MWCSVKLFRLAMTGYGLAKWCYERFMCESSECLRATSRISQHFGPWRMLASLHACLNCEDILWTCTSSTTGPTCIMWPPILYTASYSTTYIVCPDPHVPNYFEIHQPPRFPPKPVHPQPQHHGQQHHAGQVPRQRGWIPPHDAPNAPIPATRFSPPDSNGLLQWIPAGAKKRRVKRDICIS